jgi:Uma2 family endonuclease
MLAQQQPVRGQVQCLTIQQLHAMVRAGLIDARARVELVEGRLTTMVPIGPEHNDIVDDLGELFHDAFKGVARVRIQGSIMLDDRNQREPDIAVLKPKSYRKALPVPEDIFFLVEVSDTTVAHDKSTKLLAYAHYGVREVWIVDIPKRRIEISRRPVGNRYVELRKVDESGGMETIAPGQPPGIVLDLSGLFT